MLDNLLTQRADLLTQQQRMSVTHYTQRAKNQYTEFVQRLEEVEQAIKVLERKKVVMRAD